MFRTLAVSLDGSEQAERALPYSVRLAVASGARLALVRVALGRPRSGFDWERDQLAAVNEAETYLMGVAAKLARRVQVVTSVVYGDAATQLLETIAGTPVRPNLGARPGTVGWL